jgi:hypothetical protein
VSNFGDATLNDQKTLTEIYSNPIIELSRKLDVFSRDSQRNAFFVVVSSCILYLGIAVVAAVSLSKESGISNLDQSYKNLINGGVLGVLVVTLLILLRGYIGYNRSMRELKLFLVPLRELLREITALIDRGKLGEHARLALRIQTTEAEISLRRAERVAQNTIWRNGLGLAPAYSSSE